MSTSELPRRAKPTANVPPAHSALSLQRRDGDPSFWTGAAPAEVIEHYRAGDESEEWRVWRKHLAKRESRVARTFLDPSRIVDALLWGVQRQNVDGEPLAIIEKVTTKIGVDQEQGSVVQEILLDGSNRAEDDLALPYLACAYQSPALAQHLSHELWWDLLSHLHQAAIDAATVDLTTQPLLHQLLAGELPLLLSCLYPEIAECVRLRTQAQRMLSIGIEELLDGEGTPQCRYLPLQQSLVACWTRSRILGTLFDDGCWSEESEEQYPLLVREMLRLARRDGSPPFALPTLAQRCSVDATSFFETAVELSADAETRGILRSFGCRGLSKARKGSAAKLAPANHSEWAQTAVLRPDWKRSSPRLTLSYGNRVVHGELAVGRDIVLSGQWRFDCFVGEEPALATDEWEEICWVSDDDVDYLELEINLTHGLKIQRQICLARKDRFLFLADAVIGNEVRPLRHVVSMPFGSGVRWEAATECREVRLYGHKRRALVLPLALPEWRIDPRGGELLASEQGLELRQAMVGTSLFAPLWIDLDPKRHDKPFTWRQLTVAEERRNQPRDVAVGYRLQFGQKQWLVYRSLARVANRTVLGHNLSTDFLIARFSRDGKVSALIEVE